MADEINQMQMLIEIKEDIATIKQKVEDLASADAKADKALAKSIENEHRISQLSTIQNWLIGLLLTGIVIPIGIYIIDKFL
ncbi:hemolysin XhlA family protein [Oenococcus sicerae]|uniref:hemolysin XhlA family protein n=1 Tax=Oenococcus sicerae TaxID=2203724 RepID=UPI0039EC7D85